MDERERFVAQIEEMVTITDTQKGVIEDFVKQADKLGDVIAAQKEDFVRFMIKCVRAYLGEGSMIVGCTIADDKIIANNQGERIRQKKLQKGRRV